MARRLAVAISHAPGLSGTPVARPLLERGDQRVLGQLLGQADVAHDPRQPGDEPRRLDPPDRLDRAVDIAGLRRHRYSLRGELLAACASSASRSLGRELGAEVLGLEHLADLDLRVLQHRVGAALDPLDRLVLRAHLPQPEAGDQLLGLGERAVDHGALVAREHAPARPSSSGAGPRRPACTPALTSSSLNLPIAVRSSSLGITPASLSAVAFTMTMNRMSCLLGEWLSPMRRTAAAEIDMAHRLLSPMGHRGNPGASVRAAQVPVRRTAASA